MIPAYSLESGLLRHYRDRDDVARVFPIMKIRVARRRNRTRGICHDNMNFVSVAARKRLLPGGLGMRSYFLFVFSSLVLRCGPTGSHPES